MGKSDLRVFITADANSFNKNIKSAQKLLINLNNVAKNVGSGIKTALVGAFAIDSATRFFDTMIEAGKGFESQMARVQAVSNAGTRDFKMMKDEAARLGETTRFSASQAASALENLTRNGLSARKATKALSSVLELAGANAIELAEAADIVTNTMNMFLMEVEDLNKVNDVLSATCAKSATNITDLYEALKYAAPTANLFEIDIKEVNAALGVLANMGVKGSQAGTTLRSILISLIKPSAEAAKELAKYGLEINESTIKADKLLGTLQKLKNAGLSTQSGAIIFGREFGGYASALINSDVDSLYTSLDNSMGTAARMFLQGVGSFDLSINTFKSTFEGAMIKIFDAIKPAITSTINSLTNLIGVLTDIPTVAAAAGAALLGIGTKGAVKLRKEAIAANEAISYLNLLLKDLLKNLSGDSDLFIIFDDNKSSDFIGLLHSIKEEAKKAGYPFLDLAKKINSINVAKIEELYFNLLEVNKLSKELGRGRFNVASVISSGNLDEWKEGLKNDLKFIQREIQETEYINLGGKERAEKLAKDFEDAINKAFSNVDTKSVNALASSLEEVETLIGNMPKKTSVASTAFSKFRLAVSNAGTALVNFLGGWWNIGITAAIAGVTALVQNYRKMGEAVREANATINEAKSANIELSSSFKSIGLELVTLEKGSIAWENRLNHLKLNYPELTEELRLHELLLKADTKGYEELAKAMDEVIARQSKFNLSTAAIKARDNLNTAYANNDYGFFDTVLLNIKDSLLRFNKGTTNELRIDSYMYEYIAILTSGVDDAVKKSKLTEVFKRMTKEFSNVKFSDKVPEALLNDYNEKAGNEIKKLSDFFLNGETKESVKASDVESYILKAAKLLEQELINIRKDADVKYSDPKLKEDYITNESKSFANKLIQQILDKFKGIKVDGKDVRDLILSNKVFKSIKDQTIIPPKVLLSEYDTGSIADIKAKIEVIKRLLETGNLAEESLFGLTRELSTLEKELKELEDKQRSIKFIVDGDFSPLEAKLETKLETKLDTDLKLPAELPKNIGRTKKELEELKKELGGSIYNNAMNLQYAMLSLGDSFKQLANLDEIEGGWDKFATGFRSILNIIDTVVNSILGFLQLVETINSLTAVQEKLSETDNIAGTAAEAAAVVGAEAAKTAAVEASSKANVAAKAELAQAAQKLMAAESTAAYASIPFAGVGLAAALIAAMKALIAAASIIPAFATGGIVGGNSTVGDRVLARVNSGEMILNNRQLRNLFNLLNGNGVSASASGQVEFKIKGKELVGVLNNYNSIKNKVR